MDSVNTSGAGQDYRLGKTDKIKVELSKKIDGQGGPLQSVQQNVTVLESFKIVLLFFLR